MQIQITHTQPADSKAIFSLYDNAIAFQKTYGNNHWLGFEPELIAKEIAEKRHYKILADGCIAATFCITLTDPAFWEDSSTTPAIYIHRIATGQAYHGNNFLRLIIGWAIKFADEKGLLYVRMDTGSGNDRLINYYINNGFTLVGNTKIMYIADLPVHYKDGLFALLQMNVSEYKDFKPSGI